jgi:hypothetical protein
MLASIRKQRLPSWLLKKNWLDSEHICDKSIQTKECPSLTNFLRLDHKWPSSRMVESQRQAAISQFCDQRLLARCKFWTGGNRSRYRMVYLAWRTCWALCESQCVKKWNNWEDRKAALFCQGLAFKDFRGNKEALHSQRGKIRLFRMLYILISYRS